MTVADEISARTTEGARLARLRTLLQDMPWREFEAMVPELVGAMVGVRLSAAGSGFQEGADAGSVGRAGRRLRIEAKRYSSKFDARDILGGLRQAIDRDPSLECWIACATRDIPEQLASALERQGAAEGIPVMAIAWDDELAPQLAALCTHDPAIVAARAGAEAGALAAELGQGLAAARHTLARELEEWRIGFDALRAATHEELHEIWASKRAAKARFGQDVAGGDGRAVVARTGPAAALDAWWGGRSSADAPAAVAGQGGVGKTWATLGWVMARLDRLPIVVTVPAGAVPAAGAASAEGVLRLLAGQLAAVTQVRDAAHWTARLRRILSRPAEEGPAILLVLDGLNQNPAVPWLQILQLLQDRPFSGRVRTVLTTRPQHLEGTLGRTRALAEPAERVDVGRFDASPGGEFDAMLAAHGLTRGDLNPDLVEFARVPRLFDLVVRLRDRLTDPGRVTTHRLLWEYGRDVQGDRAGVSFSEGDWRAWLAEVARRERDGMRTYTLASLGETAARPDLDSGQVAARLSDIVDGNLTVSGPAGAIQLSPDIVAHALGMALLEQLDDTARGGVVSVEAALAEWLDPIDGLEERAELLRAATSIMGERDAPPAPEVAAAVVASWLQTQNLPPSHLAEIRRMAPRQVQPLLEAVERSDAGPRASARTLAVDALRSVPHDAVAYGLVVATLTRWFSRVSRDLNRRGEGFEQAEEARVRRIVSRIGVDAPGPRTVLGFAIELVDQPDDELLAAAATILDGGPLAGATEVFARAALAMAIRGRQGVWDDLKWLCLLNEVDPAETADRLRIAASEIAVRPPEEGVAPGLAARVAALLLWLSGLEADEDAAAALDPGIDHGFSYERDYLDDPATSLFRLERRHAAAALVRQDLPLRRRVQRAENHLLDPTFELPPALLQEIRAAGTGFDVSTLDVGRYHTEGDHELEIIEVALARYAPHVLADLWRRKLAGYASRPTEAFDSSAWSASEAYIVADEASRAGCRSLRERSVAAGGGMNWSSAASLLIVEIAELPAIEQVTRVLDLDEEHVLADFADVLRPIAASDVDALLDANASASPRRLGNLVCLLSAAVLDGLSDRAWGWLEDQALDDDAVRRACAFDVLTTQDATRFGLLLLAADWSWSGEANDLCRHHGSLAVAAAGADLPFEEVAPRITPALLGRAVRERGGAPEEARLAAAILDEVVMQPSVQPPDPGSALTVKAANRRADPMSFSITPGPMAGDGEHPLALLDQTDEARLEHSKRAVDTAVARVREARAQGASLFLSSVDPADLVAVASAAPEFVGRWIEGAAGGGRDFVRRIRLAEGFHLALCEVLLATAPETGATLWHALRDAMGTRFVDAAGIDERVVMLFRAPESPQVLALRDGLLDLAVADTDERLLELSAAASSNGRDGWLADVIRRDASSRLAWRRRRAVTLSGFGTGAHLMVVTTDLEGQDHTLDDERRAAAGRRLRRDAAARHWWRMFVDATDEDAAFAAWTLFRRSADRRAISWLATEAWPDAAEGPLAMRKVSHATLNERALVKEAEKRDRKVGSELFGRRISEHVAPWYRGGGPA